MVMSSHASLDAASQDRKARLAQLKSLKRKQPASDDEPQAPGELTSERKSRSRSPDIASTYLSGRNYDPLTRGPKLGFESAPPSQVPTLESQAAKLAQSTKAEAEKDEKEDKPLDLFKLQPKKPNWDLKRDLEKKLEILNVRTDNAIARLVRERIQKAQRDAEEKVRSGGILRNGGDEEGENVGIDGTTLVEAMHVREREEEEDERRDREDEELS